MVLQDITVQKQQRKALRLANEELARSNEYLTQFAYVASHALQEPLRKIMSFGNLLATQYAPELGEQGASLIERMQSATLRMQQLIHDLLTYSQLTAERKDFQPVNLNDLVQDVLSDLETAMTDSKAVIKLDKLPTLPGNALQLRQLFQNLLSNALKFRRTDVVPHIQLRSRVSQRVNKLVR